MKMKRGEDSVGGIGITHKSDHAANKVLPVSTDQTSEDINESINVEKKEKGKGDGRRAISRMKNLLKWASPRAKAEKGGKFIGRNVLHFRNRSASEAGVEGGSRLSMESPKISFRWDVESCSTPSPAYSRVSAVSVASAMELDQILLTATTAKWITTDSEFVVLEL